MRAFFSILPVVSVRLDTIVRGSLAACLRLPNDLRRVIGTLWWKRGCVQSRLRHRVEHSVNVSLRDEIGLFEQRPETRILA